MWEQFLWGFFSFVCETNSESVLIISSHFKLALFLHSSSDLHASIIQTWRTKWWPFVWSLKTLFHIQRSHDLTIGANSTVHTAGGTISLCPRLHCHIWRPSALVLPEVIDWSLSALRHERLRGLAAEPMGVQGQQTDRQTDRETGRQTVLEP